MAKNNINHLHKSDDDYALYDCLEGDSYFNNKRMRDSLYNKAITRQRIEAKLERKRMRELQDSLYDY